jgi:7,8-dihydropterin-6-yl-methyl-4-(beta-D-ribofuranosyl)aminobenzene 5'-phosphate synthase
MTTTTTTTGKATSAPARDEAVIRVTTLVDNCVRAQGLVAQHGLSFLVEGPFGRILFDTGATESVLTGNAQALGVDLSKVDHIALSHGHWDHGGGLLAAMDAAPDAPIWMHHAALLPRVHGRGESARDIALSEALRLRLVRDINRWKDVREPCQIAPGAWVTGPIPGVRPDWSHAGLWQNAVLDVPDTVREEQALVLEVPDGLVVLVGCSHFGLGNLLGRVREWRPGTPILSLVGGLHLESAPLDALEAMAGLLHEAGIRSFHPCHCSGWEASHRLAELLSLPMTYGKVGQILSF